MRVSFLRKRPQEFADVEITNFESLQDAFKKIVGSDRLPPLHGLSTAIRRFEEWLDVTKIVD